MCCAVHVHLLLAVIDPAEREQGASLSASASCRIEGVSRTAMRLNDGREVYIEPQAVVSDGGRILLAGRPTYVWTRDAPGGIQPDEGDESIGVFLDGNDATLIEAPVGARLLDDLRAASLGGGSWAVLMSELDPDSRFPERDGATHVWYAEHDGRDWTTVEEMPRPDGGRLQTFSSSELLRTDRGIGWLAQFVSPDGTGRVMYYHRGPGGWMTEVVSSRRADALSLGSSQATGVVAALAGAETGADGWTYSLRTARRASAWALDAPVTVAAAAEVIRQPSFSRTGGTATLSWIHEPRSPGSAAPGAWAAGVSVVGSFGGVEPVDRGSSRVVPVPVRDSTLIWIADHENVATGDRELRVIQGAPTGSLLLGAVPNPFTGYFTATWTDPDLVIIGPEFNPTPGSATVRSLIIRVSLSC